MSDESFLIPDRQTLRDALIPSPTPDPALRGRWAQVQAISPKLRVRMLGEDTDVPVTPMTLVADLQEGDWVWTALTDKGSLIVVGRQGGTPLPPVAPVMTGTGATGDFNAITTPGWYMVGAAQMTSENHAPTGYGGGYLEVIYGAPNTLQRFTTWSGSVSFTRALGGGAWSSWRMVSKLAQVWSACMAAEKVLSTSSNYYSYKPATVVTQENLSPTWATDALVIPESGMYIVTQRLMFTNDSTSGNRLGALLKNLGSDTYNSATMPAEAYRLAEFKAAASSDATTVELNWTGRLAANDKLILLARSSTVTNVATGYRTSITLNKIGN